MTNNLLTNCLLKKLICKFSGHNYYKFTSYFCNENTTLYKCKNCGKIIEIKN